MNKKQKLLDIADNIISGNIFCNLNIEPEDYEKYLPLVFTPLGKKRIGELDIEPNLIFAYMTDVLVDDVNEKYPSFSVVYFLNESQTDIVISRLKEKKYLK